MYRQRTNTPRRLRTRSNRSQRVRQNGPRRTRINGPKQVDIDPGNTVVLAKRQSRALRIPRNMFTVDSIIADLTYPDTVYAKNNVGSAFISWRYRMNSIYDPDPLVGSGSVPGYSYYATGYGSYRVLGFAYNVTLANFEGSPVDIVGCPSNTDLGANYSGTNELFANPHATVALLSAKNGMDRATLKGYIDLGRFSGNTSQYLGNDSFGSSFGNNPGTMSYINFGAVSSALFTTNNGIDYRVTLTYTVLFTQRKVVVS